MKLFLFLLFVTLVVFFVVDFHDIGNIQFIITSVAFVVYLIYLSGDNNMSYNSNANSQQHVTVPVAKIAPLFAKYISLPKDIAKMITTEMDQYIHIMGGMKDVSGKDPNDTTITPALYTNDPLISQNGVVDAVAFSNLKEEYFMIDKVFRDLLIADSNTYINKIYNPGS